MSNFPYYLCISLILHKLLTPKSWALFQECKIISVKHLTCSLQRWKLQVTDVLTLMRIFNHEPNCYLKNPLCWKKKVYNNKSLSSLMTSIKGGKIRTWEKRSSQIQNFRDSWEIQSINSQNVHQVARNSDEKKTRMGKSLVSVFSSCFNWKNKPKAN